MDSRSNFLEYFRDPNPLALVVVDVSQVYTD